MTEMSSEPGVGAKSFSVPVFVGAGSQDINEMVLCHSAESRLLN